MDVLRWLGVVVLQEPGPSSGSWLETGTQVLAHGAETVGAVVIAVGVLRAVFRWLGQQLPLSRTDTPTDSIRLGLGRSLGLALEFLLAADILNTAVAPSWNAIGKLAAIATIRTLLNYFLGRELQQEIKRRQADEDQQSTRRADGAESSPHVTSGRSL